MDDAEPHHDQALSALYRAHADFVWRVARALGVPEGLVDDVVHDVFFVVRRRLPTLESGRAVRPWLAGITRNVVMHVHRKLARERSRLERVEAPPTPEVPERQLEMSEAAALVHAFVETLDEDKRTVFLLCEVEGLAVVDVARVLDANPNTVYARLRAVRAQFDRWASRLRARERRAADGSR
jgi:RNA polymerase sigma-70 factor (ECF subfamily)